jgi:hypothetical protein
LLYLRLLAAQSQVDKEIERYIQTYKRDFRAQFSYPAIHPNTGKPLTIVTDPPHQWKRYRRQADDNKLEFINFENLRNISRTYPDVLPSCVLDVEFQKQSVPLACRLFHSEVVDKAHEFLLDCFHLLFPLMMLQSHTLLACLRSYLKKA